MGQWAAAVVTEDLPKIIENTLFYSKHDPQKLIAHILSVEDQEALRSLSLHSDFTFSTLDSLGLLKNNAGVSFLICLCKKWSYLTTKIGYILVCQFNIATHATNGQPPKEQVMNLWMVGKPYRSNLRLHWKENSSYLTAARLVAWQYPKALR